MSRSYANSADISGKFTKFRAKLSKNAEFQEFSAAVSQLSVRTRHATIAKKTIIKTSDF